MVEHPPQAAAAAEGGGHGPAGWPMVSIFTRSPRTSPMNPSAAAKLHGELQLRRLAEIHRAAGVDQGVEVQVLLLQKHLEEELFQPGVGVPIDEPQVVAGHVVAEIGELDALAFSRAAPFPFIRPRKTFRLTSSIFSSRASSSGLSSVDVAGRSMPSIYHLFSLAPPHGESLCCCGVLQHLTAPTDRRVVRELLLESAATEDAVILTPPRHAPLAGFKRDDDKGGVEDQQDHKCNRQKNICAT